MFSLNKMLLAAVLVLGVSSANAANVELNTTATGFYDNKMVQQGSFSFGEGFSVSASGEYKLSLRDFEFPARFDSLMVSVTQGTTELGKVSLSGAGDTLGISLFDLNKDTNYYFSLYSFNAKSNPIALYGVDLSLVQPLTPSAVPIPAAGALLLSGVAGLAGFLRKKAA